MKKQEDKTVELTESLVSLNDDLYTEFGIQELEQRLETDPLMFANLLSASDCDFECPQLQSCKKFCIEKCSGQCIDFGLDSDIKL